MRYHIAVVLSALGLCITISVAAYAAESSFAELLARAHAEADAGHQWAPPGDNVTETFMAMVNMLPEATPEQLSDFAALLRQQQQEIIPGTGGAGPTATARPANREVRKDSRSSTAKGTSPALSESDPMAAPPKASVAVGPAEVQPPSRMPAAPLSPNISSPNQPERLAAPPNDPAAGHYSVNAPPTMNTPSPPATSKSPPSQPPAFTNDLFARGYAAEERGDISTARRYYTVAAESGHAGAARALGRLYDPAFLRARTVGGIDPDPEAARRWYERAVTLGDQKAAHLLQTLSTR